MGRNWQIPPISNPAYKAAGTIHIARFVKPNGTDGQCVEAGSGDDPCGISQDGQGVGPGLAGADSTVAAYDGDQIAVRGVGEQCILQYGGTVTAGDWLKPSTNGVGIATSTVGDKCAARALQSGLSGTLGLVQVMPHVLGAPSSIPADILPIVRISEMDGVAGDADLSDASVGTDDSTAIQNGINAAAANAVFWVDGAFKAGNLKLRSGDSLVGFGGSWYGSGSAPAFGFIQAPGTQCLLRNVNWKSAYNSGSPVTDFSTITDHDITIKGVFVNGNRGTGTANNANGGYATIDLTGLNDGYANPGKLRIAPLQFMGVRNLTVSDCFIYDPASNSVDIAYVDHFDIDVQAVVPQVYAGQSDPTAIAVCASGGVAIHGTCRNGTVNASGFFGGGSTPLFPESTVQILSDTFSMNAGASYIIAEAYFPILYPGPIVNVKCNVSTPLSSQLASTWSGNESDAAHDFVSLIDKVEISGKGTFYGINPLGCNGPSAVLGKNGSTLFHDCVMTCVPGPQSFRGCFAECSHQRLRYENIYMDVSAIASWVGALSGRASALFLNMTNANRANNGDPTRLVEIVSFDVFSSSSVDFDAIRYSTTCLQTDALRIISSSGRRTQTAAGAFLALKGVNRPGNVTLGNVVANGFSNVVGCSSSNVARLRIAGYSHVNANSGYSVLVDGITVDRLVTSGQDSLLRLSIVNGGAVTVDRNDGTNDA